jgi:hypothetical protein
MQVVSTCLARDLPIYQLTCRGLRTHLPDAEIHAITRRSDFEKFRDACGSELRLWDEDTLVPEMTLASLRAHPLPFFPAGAGWYFQQFLKWGFIDVSNSDPHFLIWDADTVLLRPLELFDDTGTPFLTRATEHHLPYFQTFEELVGEAAPERGSFISQHQVVEKSILLELLDKIAEKSPSGRGWAWAIIENLQGKGTNLFSEYETYGNFVQLRHPENVSLRGLPWTRDGRKLAGKHPSPSALAKLAEHHAFAAFESNKSLRGVCVNRLRKLLNWY